MITDPNVEQVRKVREELLKRHGGLQGWIRQLQKEEKNSPNSRPVKQRVGMAKPTKAKQTVRAKTTRQTSSSKKRG